MNNELIIAVTAGLGGMIGWGFSDFFAANSMKKHKLNEVSASFFLYLITSIILWTIILVTKEPMATISITVFLQLFMFALINVAAYIFFLKALNVGNLSTISTIFSTYAVGASLISIVFFKEATSLMRIISLLIVFFGVAGVSIQQTTTKKLNLIKGLGSVLIAALLLSFVFPFWDSFLANQGGWLYWLAMTNTLMTILFLVTMRVRGEKKINLVKGVKVLIWGGIANALAVFATNWGFGNTTLTSVVVVVSSAVPVISATLGYFVFKEKLNKYQILGIGGIILGTTLLFIS